MAEFPRRATLFEPGRNCWRIETAARAAFLVDADIYFKAFVAAARRAQRSLLIIGWDFHSRTPLLRAAGQHPALELGPFLNELARAHRELRIQILIWDYPMIFGLDREWGPLYGLGWRPHRRIAFRYDNTHPVGGSHHQKIVVIDDVLAFNGGIDLTSRRWDTCEHTPDNPHRIAGTNAYPPFHDVMVAVEGAAARALGELARERWYRATGEIPERPRLRQRLFGSRGFAPSLAAHWPDWLRPDVHEAAFALSRTAPSVGGSEGLREVEALYLDMIAAAHRSIYIENQYLTAERIGEALSARLAEPQGPEVVIVLRELSHGWLEELTMQTLRTRLLERLRMADRYARLSVYYPFIAGLKSGTCIDVHSKVIIIDEELLRIGSANLANRSLRLDTECDLTLEARGRQDLRDAIGEFRARLIAEHLGCTPAQLCEAIGRAGSLRGAIAQCQREDRTLRALVCPPQVSAAVLNVISVADPEKPVALADLVKLLGDMDEAAPVPYAPAWGKISLFIMMLVAMTAAWQLTPLKHVVDGERVVGWARDFGDEWWAPVLTALAYTPAALTLFPRPLITLFAVLAFGPLLGFLYAMLGIELAAWVSFLVGRKLDRRTVQRLAGAKLHGILQVLRRRGLVAMTALRLVPLAPFAVEGVVAGAVRVRLKDFMLGTAIGMLPGTLTSTVFGEQLQVWLEDPSRINYWLIALVLLVLGLATWLVRRWLVLSAPAAAAGQDVNGARAI